MNPFSLASPKSHAEAHRLLGDKRFKLPVLKGAGMDLLDHMKEGLSEPDLLIDVRPLRAGRGDMIRRADGGRVLLEASTTLAMIGASDLLKQESPVVAAACQSAASPQIRNVATAAGNLLQRPRCWYYRNKQFDCLKKGGHRCYAFDGENRHHAIFGEGPCHIVHPSNLALGLAVCDGVVHLHGGEREALAMDDLYHMPELGIRDEHNLEQGEIITHIMLSPRRNSGFHAVKEKQSFDWPIVAAAASFTNDEGRIRDARVCAGAVAPVPWMLPNVAESLEGLATDDAEGLKRACARASEGARPMSQNAYKVKILPVAVRRAVEQAIAGGES